MSFMSSFSGSSSSRAGYAPRRGRGRGGRIPFTKGREQIKPDIEKHPLGELLKTFHSSDLGVEQSGFARHATISDCQYVASYNWLNDRTIIVPGKPPQWTPLRTPQRLPEDSGQYFRDPNAAKFPDHPMAPVVHAVLDTDPSFGTASVDLFACGSTLGNLLRFARGADKAFRFNVERIGNTAFFVRRENDPKEIIKDVRGFGHTFPEAYTTWEKEVQGSDTHQRIVRYDFGGLKCLVRFESDGYIKDTSVASGISLGNTPADENDLLQAFHDATISQVIDALSSKTKSIAIKHGGSAVPQNAIFDLKTRSGKWKKNIDMGDIYPQLWIKQIPNFIVAYHDGHGLFEDVRVQDVKNDVQAWEKENIDGIRRFAALLNGLIEVAKNDKKGLLEIYCPGPDRLEIRSQHGEGVHALPEALQDRWVRDTLNNDSMPHNASDDDLLDRNGYDSDDGGVDLVYSYDGHRGYADDSDDEPDYTACSAHDCGYCGKCSY